MSLTFEVAQIGSENFTADNGSASGNFTSVHTLTNSAANMAGNYPSNKSFVIVGKLEDKFTSVDFSATVATESVVMSYDKNGRVGIGKVAEFGKPGSLDVLGDIYSNNKPIQQYQLTKSDGGLSRGSAQWDDVWNKQATEFGWRSGNYEDNPTGRNGAWGLFQNFWLDSWKIVQTFVTMSSSPRMFLRISNDGNRWSPSKWREVLFKDELGNANWQKLVLQNGWNHHSTYGDAYYSKTLDGVVYLRGNVYKGSIDKETTIAVLPEGFRPRSSMYLQALNNSYGNAILCLYTDGRLVVKSNVDATWLNFDNVSFKI